MNRPAIVRLVRLAVAATILVALFRFVPLDDVLARVRRARTIELAIAIVLALGSQVAVAGRLRVLAGVEGIDRSLATLLQINLSTLFYGLLLPAGNVAGIAVRLVRISDRTRDLAGTAVVLVLDRVVATWSLCVIGFVAWVLVGAWSLWPLATVMALIVLAAPASARLVGPAGRLVPRSFRESRLAKRLAPTSEAVLRAVSWSRTVRLRVIALSLLAHGFGIGAYVSVARSLGLDLPLAVVAWIRSAAVLVATVPISIAGIGVRETAFVVLLDGRNVGGDVAVTFALLAFATTVLAMALAGGVSEATRLVLTGRRVAPPR